MEHTLKQLNVETNGGFTRYKFRHDGNRYQADIRTSNQFNNKFLFGYIISLQLINREDKRPNKNMERDVILEYSGKRFSIRQKTQVTKEFLKHLKQVVKAQFKK